MAHPRLPFRDPRTVARDIPGVLDVLFPRLSGSLVTAMNKKMFSFDGVKAIPDDLIDRGQAQKAMIFEMAVARTEFILKGNEQPDWQDCLNLATKRQKRHYDAKIPEKLNQFDVEIAAHAASNLVTMLRRINDQYEGSEINISPAIPGMGWISSGHGDFEIGNILVEVKHTDRNFIAADFRQVLIYWILKYAESIGTDIPIWTDLMLINPRRNSALILKFDYLLRAASANSNRVELFELLRSIADQDPERR